ncbi:uncharacterized protein BJ212DRAFT_1345513 [Suillus subaureus]|uniref:tRNA-binding domain-containing protein n=1 Tax=Suillus subaureus TaxID=48587 RepID=A0A9P7JET1_9AGAM|nr:uncharacterized protein BJ212DRAFT_1345513 [Suillus subaureus]KAG1818433.1 hypothetical protein BJ212DRAFT_1345513 [Suillus subaureus]
MNTLTRSFHLLIPHRLSARLIARLHPLARAMSYESSISRLPSPLKDLVVTSQADVGKTEADKAEVAQWIEKVAEGEVALPDLETQLVPRTYIVSNYLTAADVALYGALHPVFSQLQPAQLYSTPAVTRYFDHIQTRPSFSSVSFDLASAPPIERKVDAPKKKEKAAAVAEQVEPTAVAPVSKENKSPEDKPKEKKEKKKDAAAADNGGKKKEKASTPAGGKTVAEDAGEPVPSMIDMRIGHIVDVKKHPEADSLYIEQIDLGEETGPRTVVSGLVSYIPIEEMRDKYLVCICNLKPANMRGVKSFAMVLAATSKDGKDGGVELIQPPPGCKPGERVYFEGPDYENALPLAQMNPKKKIFETIQPGAETAFLQDLEC